MRAPVIQLVDPDTGEVVARVAAPRADLALVDALARAQLAAGPGGPPRAPRRAGPAPPRAPPGPGRRGRRVRLRGAGPELRGLLELVGLAGVLAGQPRREPELG